MEKEPPSSFHYVVWNKKKVLRYWEAYQLVPELTSEYFCEKSPGWLIPRIQKYLPEKAEVLDVGFGSARLLFELARYGHVCHGIDPAGTNIHKIRQKAEEIGVNVKAGL